MLQLQTLPHATGLEHFETLGCKTPFDYLILHSSTQSFNLWLVFALCLTLRFPKRMAIQFHCWSVCFTSAACFNLSLALKLKKNPPLSSQVFYNEVVKAPWENLLGKDRQWLTLINFSYFERYDWSTQQKKGKVIVCNNNRSWVKYWAFE